MSEQIGKHKGAVETLLHEKKELSRLLKIVNSQLQRHLSALEDAGIDTDRFIQEVQQESQQGKKGGQQERQNQSSQRSRSEQRSEQDNQEEPEEDADELLEGEDDFGDRDFSPR